MKKKEKVEPEKPVFVVVEQTDFIRFDAYRVVLQKNLKNNVIILDGVNYKLVESIQPTINAHQLRQYCQEQNPLLKQQRYQDYLKRQQERQQKLEEKRQQQREANRQERKLGARHAGIILKEMAIRSRMMEEVESGQRCL